MTGTPSLRWLLGWAHRSYSDETPELQHAVSRMDEGGAPAMRKAIGTYLGLDGSAKARRTDALDDAGRYRTPFRAALERIRDRDLRCFIRDLAPNALNPSIVTQVHGLPKWSEPYVMHHALLALWHEYREQPYAPERGWISGNSDSQRNAIMAGEAV